MEPTLAPTVIMESVTTNIGIYLGFILTGIAAISALVVAITGARKAGREGAKGVLEEQENRVERLRKDIACERADNDAMTIKLVATIARLEVGEVASRQTLLTLSEAQARALLNEARLISLEADLAKVKEELATANKVANTRIEGLEKENKALRLELKMLAETYNDAIESWAKERGAFQKKIDGLATIVEESKKSAEQAGDAAEVQAQQAGKSRAKGA